MSNFLYVSRSGLPFDAAGIRIYNVSCILRKLGHSVHFFCDRRVDETVLKSEYSQISKCLGMNLRSDEVHFVYDGFVYSYKKKHKSKIHSIIDIFDFFFPLLTLKKIKKICKEERIKYIIFYNDSNFLAKKIRRFCKKHQIKIIADITEWYEELKIGTIIEKKIPLNVNKRFVEYDKLLDGVIVISPFLKNYYNSIGVKNIFLPPLMQIEDINFKCFSKCTDGLIRFVYAGNPGSKDIVYPFIDAVINFNKKNKKFAIDLIGITLEGLKNNGCHDACLENGIFVHGKLPNNEAKEIIKNAHFGFLFRNDKRYAKAGFSTKFAECMSLGVPMVCNRIGGTDQFVNDGIDGFLIDSIDDRALHALLYELSQKDLQEIIDMKKSAFLKAKTLFSISNYFVKINEFLDNIV